MRLIELSLAGAHLPDRLRACLGAAIGIGLTVLVSSLAGLGAPDLPVIVAPLGASAVLVFAVPGSPLAQPWSVIGGNVVSALVGMAAYRLLPGPGLGVTAGVAVGGAILAMSLLRCLHPPGGAAALTAVIGGPAIHAAGFGFALVPVGLNSLVLVAAGVLFHRLGRHSYPHRPAPATPAGVTLDDIDAALAQMDESFDIRRDDLAALLTRAERHAEDRRRAPAVGGRA